jgi:hypothetical protein
MLLDMRKSITLLLLMLGLGMGATAVKGQLMITEIMYRSPASRPNLYPDSLQFIEIYNNTDAPIDMNGYTLTGVTCIMPQFILNPGEFVLFCRDGVAVMNYMGIPASNFVYNWNAGHLDTVSTTIKLRTPQGMVVDSVPYNVGPGWPIGGHNDGHSITLCDFSLDNALGSSWISATTPLAGAVSHGIQIFANPLDCCGSTDQIAPQIVSAGLIDLAHIAIVFDEPLGDPSTWLDNFSGNANISTASFGATKDSIILTLSPPMADGHFDTIFVDGVIDLSCNTMVADSFQIVFNGLANRLNVVEIMYDGSSGIDSLQYIEYGNRESFPIEIGGYSIRNGAVTLTHFPQQVVPADGRVVVAKYPEVVERVFGISNVIEWESGTLSGLDHLELWNSVQAIDNLTYESTSPWPQFSPAMQGRSIRICDIQDINVDPLNWGFSGLPGEYHGVYGNDSIYGSPGTSNCLAVGILSGNESKVTILPNPSNGKFQIEYTSGLFDQAYILDGVGRLVQTFRLDNGFSKVDISDSPKGIYFLKLLSTDGQSQVVKKLIFDNFDLNAKCGGKQLQ